MTEKALLAGAEAFNRGVKRDANPYDASAQEWMCWRDGWEQEKAAALRSNADRVAAAGSGA